MPPFALRTAQVLYNQVTKFERQLVRHAIMVSKGAASGPYLGASGFPAPPSVTKTRPSAAAASLNRSPSMTEAHGGSSGARLPPRSAFKGTKWVHSNWEGWGGTIKGIAEGTGMHALKLNHFGCLFIT